jgi:hypothetical protein
VFKNPRESVMKLLQEGVSSLKTKFGKSNASILSTCESLLNLSSNAKQTSDGWRFPADWHVTCAYLGRDEDKADLSQVYQNFVENVKVDVDICAFVVVPNKIVTGICFPNQSVQRIENACPHVTLAINEWHPKESNILLEKSCLKESGPFHQVYKSLKLGHAIKEGKELQMGSLRLASETASVAAYLVVLPQAVRFNGTTKAEY